MNLECRIPNVPHLLRVIEEYPDLDYYSPCQLAPLLAQELVQRVDAPFGGIMLELTPKGRTVAGLAKKGCSR